MKHDLPTINRFSSRLTPSQERVLRMAAEGMEYLKMAKELGITENAVKIRVSRANRKLNEVVDREARRSR